MSLNNHVEKTREEKEHAVYEISPSSIITNNKCEEDLCICQCSKATHAVNTDNTPFLISYSQLIESSSSPYYLYNNNKKKTTIGAATAARHKMSHATDNHHNIATAEDHDSADQHFQNSQNNGHTVIDFSPINKSRLDDSMISGSSHHNEPIDHAKASSYGLHNKSTPLVSAFTKVQTIVDSNKIHRIASKDIKEPCKQFFKSIIKTPKALQTPDRNQPPIYLLDTNVFTIKKTLMTLICLLIIIMANSIQLKYVIKNGVSGSGGGAMVASRASVHSYHHQAQFYGWQIFLCMSSVLLSSFIGLILMYSSRIDYNDAYKQRKLDFLNNFVMILLFILCIFNIFLVSMN